MEDMGNCYHSTMNNHYIYVWKEAGVAGSGLPFYIGQGKYHKNSKYKRAYEVHRGNASRKNPAYCQSKANKLFELGTPHVVEILYDGISKSEADRLEVLLISRLGRISIGTGILTNLSDGGDFNPTSDPVVEARRLAVLDSKEYRENMSNVLKNRYRDNPEYAKRISDRLKEHHHNDKTITFNGIEYKSVKELSKFLGIPYETIRSRIKMGIPLDKKRVR